ncbi:hypothetical protein PABY_05940 [Pyrodictium abyssi]|uniref:Uncharacterized protein n=1 Tax=Pyrodictium abyssi TaxID=54256 RepID=A0ABM8ITZ2_9CREN|nr:hypothetical protein PABY_05940 [Pyrodictium abyssi]
MLQLALGYVSGVVLLEASEEVTIRVPRHIRLLLEYDPAVRAKL